MEVVFQVDLEVVGMEALLRSVQRLQVIQKMVITLLPKVSMDQEIAIQIVGVPAVLESQQVVVPNWQMFVRHLVQVAVSLCLDWHLKVKVKLMRTEGVSVAAAVMQKEQGH